MAELLVSYFSLFRRGVPSLILNCVSNQKVISVFQKVFSHLSYNGVKLTAPLEIVHGVSLLPCDGVLQLQWFPLTLVYFRPATTSASKLQDIMLIQ